MQAVSADDHVTLCDVAVPKRRGGAAIVLRDAHARAAEPDALAPAGVEQHTLQIGAVHHDREILEPARERGLTRTDEQAAVPCAQSSLVGRHAEGLDLVSEADLAERADRVEPDRNACANFAERIDPLEDLDADAGPVERDRGGQSRDPAADDDSRQRPSHDFNNSRASCNEGTTAVAASLATSDAAWISGT